MPSIKNNFYLKYEDTIKLREAITKFGRGAEETINKCLQDMVAPKMTSSVTMFLPRSATGKRHAKDNQWYDLEYYNLSFVLSNSLKGKRKTSFYYLYYPATGTGQSYKRGPNDFMGKGVNVEYSKAVSDLLNALMIKLEKEI